MTERQTERQSTSTNELTSRQTERQIERQTERQSINRNELTRLKKTRKWSQVKHLIWIGISNFSNVKLLFTQLNSKGQFQLRQINRNTDR